MLKKLLTAKNADRDNSCLLLVAMALILTIAYVALAADDIQRSFGICM